MYMRYFCYYVYVFVHVYAEGCKKVFTINTDTECENLNCTQGKRFDGDAVFGCNITRQNGWTHFVTRHGPFEVVNESDLEPPRITAIEWYLRNYGKEEYDPTLKFTFTYSPRMKNISSLLNKTGKEYIVRAVKMTWRGVDDPYYFDTFYSLAKPRIRLFDFNEYIYTTYDRSHPREITYPCITGLDTCNSNKKYYTLELAAISFEPRPLIYSTTYDVTTFNHQDKIWQPAIATAVIPYSCSIYIVFEPAPTFDGITEYEIVLTNRRSGETMTREPTTKFTAMFSDLQRSLFELEIRARGGRCSNYSCVFTARTINVTSSVCKNLEDIESGTAQGNKEAIKIVYALIGVVASFVLLAFVARQIYHNKYPRNPLQSEPKTLLILYSNRSPYDEKLIQCLAGWVQEKCPSYTVSWDNNSHGYIYSNVDDWYQNQINDASKIMIVCPAVWEEDERRLNRHTPVQPYFIKALRYATRFEQCNQRDNKWMFFVCFKFSDRNNIPVFLKNRKRYHFPKEINTFCSCLKNKTSRQLFRSNSLERSESGKKLLQAIDEVHQNNIRPPSIEQTIGPLSEEVKDENQENHFTTIEQHPNCPIHGNYEKVCPVHGIRNVQKQYVPTQSLQNNATNQTHENQFVPTQSLQKNATSQIHENQFVPTQSLQKNATNQTHENQFVPTQSLQNNATIQTHGKQSPKYSRKAISQGNNHISGTKADIEPKKLKSGTVIPSNIDVESSLYEDTIPNTNGMNDLNLNRDIMHIRTLCENNIELTFPSINYGQENHNQFDVPESIPCIMVSPVNNCQGHHYQSMTSNTTDSEEYPYHVTGEESESLLNTEEDISEMFERLNFGDVMF